MDALQILSCFQRNHFPFEIDEEIIQYISEILRDNSLTKQEKDDIILGILESSYGDDVQELLRVIIQDLTNPSHTKGNSKGRNQKKKHENSSKAIVETTPPTVSVLPVALPQAAPPPQQQQNKQTQKTTKSTTTLKSSQQSYQPPKTIEQESLQLQSLRNILHQQNISTESVDETITEYLNEICSDEMMSIEELQEIILTYFPSLDGDVEKARRIVMSLLTQNFSSGKLSTTTITPTAATTADLNCGHCRSNVEPDEENGYEGNGDENDEHDDDDDALESKSNGSDLEESEFDEDEDQEDSELTVVNVDEIQEIFPTIPTLSLQYLYHVKCFHNFTETCQYLLDHQTEADLEQLSLLAAQFHEKSLQKRNLIQKENHEIKKKIFDKYGDQIILRREGGGTKKEKKEPSEAEKLRVLSMIGKQSHQRVRYRDNKIASTKGEKIIIEKNPQDDSDGGSRGRVKTKGKRGPGFVMS